MPDINHDPNKQTPTPITPVDSSSGVGETIFTVVPDKPEVVITRVFDAPREKVFKAYTDREAIPQWWGPRILTTIIDQLDFRVGGKWRFIQRDPKGQEFAFHGEYKEIVPPEKLVQTFNYEGIPPGHEVTETAVFEDLGNGQTKLVSTSVFLSLEDRDGMVGSGMESGATEGMERLAELMTKS